MVTPFWILLACVPTPADDGSKRSRRDDVDSACDASDAACTDPGGIAALQVTPNPVIFGTVAVGETAQQAFTISSVGDADLAVTALEVGAGADWFRIDTDGVIGTYAPGVRVDVLTTYLSPGVSVTGQVVVLSNDPGSPTTVVDLLGGASAPDLVIDPDSVRFGVVPVGATGEQTVDFRNLGGLPLTVTSVRTSDPVFDYGLSEALPLTIAPGASKRVAVGFSPSAEGSWTGELQVESDDPNGREVAVLNGSAGSGPVAVCDVTPRTVEAIHETAAWVGSSSYDPDGYALTGYVWTLVSTPAGSAAFMPAGTGADRSGFQPDLVGTYQAQLVVTNSIGERSAPCIATLEAEPFGGLWIEMFWRYSGDDMDLHLVAPVSDPTGALVTSDDCYYANCLSGLAWGAAGTADDPSLDLDDVPGTGPENINLASPENGVFTVFVRDYPGSVYSGSNDVTVNIYVDGILAWTDTRNCDGEGDYFPFAEIDWPAGTVTDL